MKWLAVCLLLLTGLLLPGAVAETVVIPPFLPQVGRHAKMPWFRYDNQVYLYGFSLPGEFVPDDPAATDEQFANQTPDAPDYLYDLQRWHSLDGRITFEFQLKKPSYSSVEEEAGQLPEYLEQLRIELTEQDIHDVRFSNEDQLLHETPVGTMLEVPIAFDIISSTGQTHTINSVYYDYYDENNEYIFSLQGIQSSYLELADMLHQIVQTVCISPILLESTDAAK